MKQDKKKLLQIISKAAHDYEKHLNNKYFLIVFQEGRKIECVQIGFRIGKAVDIPVTLYREDVRKMVQPVKKVLGIFAKHYNEVVYSKCTYLAKDHCLEEFKKVSDVEIGITNDTLGGNWGREV